MFRSSHVTLFGTLSISHNDFDVLAHESSAVMILQQSGERHAYEVLPRFYIEQSFRIMTNPVSRRLSPEGLTQTDSDAWSFPGGKEGERVVRR